MSAAANSMQLPGMRYFNGNTGSMANWDPNSGQYIDSDGNRINADAIRMKSNMSQEGVSGELYDMLMKRAKQGTVIDRNDPNLRQQIDPYTAQVERQRRDYLADTAERAGPNANMQGEARVSGERAGQASGLFEATLIGKELTSRRDEIKHALDSLRGQLSQEQQLALQKELAGLEDATRRYGIDADAKTAAGQLGLGYGNLGLGQDQLGLDYNKYNWATDPRNPVNLPRVP